MTSKKIVLPHFQDAQVIVYGDVMLDRYWHGDASRISPEAPVPVVNVTEIETRPGGAANVAQNMAALGVKVTLCGLVGQDSPAQELQQCLDGYNVDCRFLSLPDFLTITKLRVLGHHQQLIRMDFEKTTELEINDDALFDEYREQLKTAKIVVLSDYSKGALCHVERLIAAANTLSIPTLVDPKHKDYSRYAGATILTPNLKEFESVVGPCRDLTEITQKAHDLLARVSIQSLLVTLGKDGMVWIAPGKDAVHFASKARDVFDVTGAGDTVIAVLAAGLAAGMDTLSAVELANLAAGVVVGKLGAQAVTLSDLQQALLRAGDLSAGILDEQQLLLMIADARARDEKIVMTNGCFDILHVGHVDYLAKAKALGHRLIVAVNDDDSVRRLKGNDRPLNSVEARMTVLSALGCVDWVILFSEDTPARLISVLNPDILVKGGDYQVHEIAGSDFVLENGGEVLTIPLVDGFSTTKLIESVKELL
ncbi:MAG: bifunctional heptose 7-phosphate kinase/heptose 1-phosphate adenyltransferase [Gammaproteobacteria bacterium CG_4_10_14_0_8_um_filter_38_16]|nr:MAG: bifunctional heptose 7-phosphate kinase/heptose 1-phosphate adenyltransferase [Gammaproteobacteria bacterium CG_4_10_14_0_8_um_filter_38_16]PJA04338.1 MAG: bifunctional heptose 7-phosphate kinase/heptose 1-phosphate adenyltransferase [Gammaproteobacteria bacterium CG_4_10_14_0_2_um_filter_38_22]PJB10110.1 MAG: bifunctional heptose 7-phosphate kinase/heptose 1-phosphate adenyltransferase [Gammaproteobacteria bacterium CG_4_9_14_3_um_filter_38_9]